MRFVSRTHESPIPGSLRAETQAVLDEYYLRPDVDQRQQRAPLDRLWDRVRHHVREPLLHLFDRKCAYCESSLGITAEMEIDQFRPVSASDLDGTGSLGHYQWLRLEWENLYPSCPACNRAKRGLFPVRGQRADLRTPPPRIADAEHALLLDPCRDHPGRHLEFTADGMVRGLSEEGVITVKVLALDRPALVQARLYTWNETVRGVQTR